LSAKSVAYADPAWGLTGVLVQRVFERLGLTEEMRRKTKFPPIGQFAPGLVARGEAELAISQPMEILAQPGVEFVGLLPRELQDMRNFVFSAAILNGAKEPKAGKALMHFLAAPSSIAVLRAKGMEPE
jgi:molybdate transport system substrate-binding protein